MCAPPIPSPISDFAAHFQAPERYFDFSGLYVTPKTYRRFGNTAAFLAVLRGRRYWEFDCRATRANDPLSLPVSFSHRLP